MKQTLAQKLEKRTAQIGIIGLGYVGLPLAIRFAQEQFKVTGFDIDQNKVASINKGKSYLHQYRDDLIQTANRQGFSATSDFRNISEMDAIIICVPTPLSANREPDLCYIIDTMKNITPHLREDQLLSLESTTYPGTTDEVVVPYITSRGFKIGQNYFVVFSPEREDPGREDFNTKTIPKVVGGMTSNCLEMGLCTYGKIVDRAVPVSSTKVAEMTKLLENIHRSVNIGLVNEMKIVADKMGIDIHEVIQAAATKPFGFVPYRPGPGLGGHCIPIDPFYLTWKAREYGVHTRFIELAGEINSYMPQWVVSKVADALNDREKPIKKSKVLVLGLAYKKNVDDMRESPSLEIIEHLLEKGANVAFNDPFFDSVPRLRKHDLHLQRAEFSAASLASFDCVVIATDHDQYDYNLLQKHAQLIVDCRGVYAGNFNNVVKA